jgi:hypothetical protein
MGTGIALPDALVPQMVFKQLSYRSKVSAQLTQGMDAVVREDHTRRTGRIHLRQFAAAFDKTGAALNRHAEVR